MSIFILTKMTYFALFLGFPSACHILTLDILMTNSSHVLFHQMSLSLFLEIHFFFFYVHQCLAQMFAYVADVFLVPSKFIRGC